ncbi:MAG TPA: GlsB/YeaQ/YmgE family stress response membrane protein [Bacteroidales bacterium]|nr:GlsB/YeaQ/YmgE family stress response membrane protein [Bacteroidales bacterium]
MGFFGSIIIGILAGFIAGKIMKGGGFGLLINLFVGLIGSMLGGWLFRLLSISSSDNFLGQLVTATVGAIVFLWILSLF